MGLTAAAGAVFLLLSSCRPFAVPSPPAPESPESAPPAPIELARGGSTRYVIELEPAAGETESLAARELSRYLEQISGARFGIAVAAIPGARPDTPARTVVATRANATRVIALRATGVTPRGSAPFAAHAAADAYRIAVRGDSLILTGASPRALLYAAYDLLERLGCEWLAPAFALLEGAHEVVPQRTTLVYAPAGDVAERPAFGSRELDVGQSASHDTRSLLHLVEWMPKLRYNTFKAPLENTSGSRAGWDAWRDAVTPELRRRGMIIEVGGHGYENFLHADMPVSGGGTLFERHPEWFGRDAECRPSRARATVFNTANDGAVAFLVRNVVRYVAERPEIDIFDFWPPDGVKWAACGRGGVPPATAAADPGRGVRAVGMFRSAQSFSQLY